MMEGMHPFNPLKLLCHSDRMSMEIPYPVALNLDITNRCNQNCIWCYVKKMRTENKIDMKIGIASSIINNFRSLRPKTECILFTGGGEPTLHPRFMDLVALSKSFGYRIGLTTNGTMLGEISKDMGKKDIGVRYVRVSIDAASRETYSKVHGCKKNEFDAVLVGAEEFSHQKKDCTLGFAFLVTPENFHEVGNAIVLAEKAGFDYISFRPSVFGHLLSKEQKTSALAAIEEKMNDAKIKIYPIKKRFENEGKRYKCRSTPLVAVVTADAKLNLCCQYRGRKEWQFGDLTEKFVKELWLNNRHRELLKKAEDADCPKCRMAPYNEIIQKIFIDDEMHRGFV